MNMTEFVNEMMKSIPHATTLQQEMVQKAVEEILENLRKYGHVQRVWNNGDGNHSHCCQVCRRVSQIFEARGYMVESWAYSERNRYGDHCVLNVWLP